MLECWFLFFALRSLSSFSLVSFDLFFPPLLFLLLLLPSPSSISFFLLLLLFPPFANCVMYHNPGIVVRIGREKLSVLLQGGAVQQVLPSDLHYGNQNMQSKRAVTLDSRKQAVSETDAGAATKRISKSFLFFFGDRHLSFFQLFLTWVLSFLLLFTTYSQSHDRTNDRISRESQTNKSVRNLSLPDVSF